MRMERRSSTNQLFDPLHVLTTFANATFYEGEVVTSTNRHVNLALLFGVVGIRHAVVPRHVRTGPVQQLVNTLYALFEQIGITTMTPNVQRAGHLLRRPLLTSLR